MKLEFYLCFKYENQFLQGYSLLNNSRNVTNPNIQNNKVYYKSRTKLRMEKFVVRFDQGCFPS